MKWFLSRLFKTPLRGVRGLTRLYFNNDPFPTLPTRTTHGLLYYADHRSTPVDLTILRQGYFEPHVLANLQSAMKDGDVFWDIGANTGIHSLTVKRLMPGVKVVSFEPSPLNFSRLFLNARANGLDLDLRCIALSNKQGYAPLSIMAEGNSGLNSLRPWTDVTYSSVINCWCDTGDHMVSTGTLPSPNVIKMDVEGFEYEVFSGMLTVLDSPALRHIAFEARPDLLEENSSYQVAKLLRDKGFTIRRLGDTDIDYVATRN